MAVRGVDHINIGTHQLEETRAFFREAIGLTEGWRPDFQFGGAWLYAGEQAVVHLVDLASPKHPSSEAALDHFAFRIDDWDAAIARLDGWNMLGKSQAITPRTTMSTVNGIALSIQRLVRISPIRRSGTKR